MAKTPVYSLRVSAKMDSIVTKVMASWHLDRTTFLKLAAYMCAGQLARRGAHTRSLAEIVAELEKAAPASFPGFAEFSAVRLRRTRRRSRARGKEQGNSPIPADTDDNR